MFKPKFDLGDLLEDKVTGYKGVVMAVSFYSTGCIHYGLSLTKAGKDGKLTQAPS